MIDDYFILLQIGFMVGRDAESGGIAKNGAKMVTGQNKHYINYIRN